MSRPAPEAPTPGGPAWPMATPQPVPDDSTLKRLIATLREQAPAAIGLWAAPDPARGSHDADDWRGARPGPIALAIPASNPTTHSTGNPTPHAADDPTSLDTTFAIDPDDHLDLTLLLRWLAEPDAPYVVTHGAQITMHRLLTWAPNDDAPIPARLGCTRVAAVLLTEGARRGTPTLSDCVARALDRPWPLRDSEPLLAETSDTVAAATAASALMPLMRALTPMLRQRDLTRVFELECRLAPAVVAMERAGVGVDAAGFQRVVDGWIREQPTATEPERKARLAKLVSTYGYWPREYISGDRIHCRLHPLAADSGRFSCSEPNLQQVPTEHVAPGLRACFRAPEGHVLIVADYAQIELRVAAHLAPCEALRAVFREGRDPHRATAATLARRPESEITARERQLAKAVNFGFLFGMGAPRFREYAKNSYGLELDMAQAKDARAAFLRTFPGIAAWHRRVGQLGRGPTAKAITVRTALGRRKRFAPDRFSFNAALNIPVQGTAADGFKLAMTRLHPRLRALGGRGILSVHDEYLAEVPAEQGEPARQLVQQTMREAMQEIVTSVPIEVEAAIARSWAEK
ncbi:MAG: DNA polymerase [Myxococcota bacterium]